MKTRYFRSLLAVCALSVALIAAGCGGKHGTAIQNDEGEPTGKPAGPLSSLKLNDPVAPAQLLKGFYGVESGSWRWTAGNFSVLLKSPAGAAQKGGTLTLAIMVSDIILKQVHSQTLKASIGGQALAPATYTAGGRYTYSADVPAATLAGDTVTVDFSLDKSLPPSPSDLRELGVIATAVGIESK